MTENTITADPGNEFEIRFKCCHSPDRSRSAIAWLLVAIIAVSTTGCGGCRDDSKKKERDKVEAAKKEKEKKKPPFETRRPVVVPGRYAIQRLSEDDPNKIVTDETLMRENRVKLGHWTVSQQPIVSNLTDLDGRLETLPTTGSGELSPIRFTDRVLHTTRAISLPKGQWKNLETTNYLPRREIAATSSTLRYSMRDRGRTPIYSTDQPTILLKDFQYHLVVLSQTDLALRYLNDLDCIVDKGDDSRFTGRPPSFYNLVPSTPGSPLPVPRSALAWTSIAYVVWFDADPNSLDQDQQQAMIDWMHWGGQLIISGPDSLNRLNNSFLADFLPAVPVKPANLSQQDIDPLNHWSIQFESDDQSIRLGSTGKMLGVELQPQGESLFVEHSGNLVCERRLGRGRIVVTAFSLDSSEFSSWKCVSNFFHNVLLRRPRREFYSNASYIGFAFPDYRLVLPSDVKDPLLGSAVRYISRDLYESSQASLRSKPQSPYFVANNSTPTTDDLFSNPLSRQRTLDPNNIGRDNILTKRRSAELENWRFGGFSNTEQSGVAGWNDFGAISNAARSTIRRAAGVTPPSAGFVLRMLLIYLAILVPVNWLFFRVIGKVEWAWVAAPIIAVIGAVIVTKSASLDIGFARSRNEISLLEIHGGFPRGHMTTYTALYTSLSTRYDLQIDDSQAQILPFAVSSFQKHKSELKKFDLIRARKTVLDNFSIQSNSTGLLHSEIMIETGGPISLLTTADGKFRVNNGSDINLRDVGVMRSRENGQLATAWIGDLTAGSESSDLGFRENGVPLSLWGKSPRMTGRFKSAEFLNDQIQKTLNDFYIPSVAEIKLQMIERGDWDKLMELENDFRIRQIDLRDEATELTPDDLRNIRDTMLSSEEIHLGLMAGAVVNDLKMGTNAIRLVGWTDEPVSPSVTKPAATQEQRLTLVVVHLRHGDLPAIKSDTNCLRQIE